MVGIYHSGIEKDLETGSVYTSTTGENQGYKFYEDFDLDILITGNEHREIVSTVNGVVVTQSTNKVQSMIVIEFIEKKLKYHNLLKLVR